MERLETTNGRSNHYLRFVLLRVNSPPHGRKAFAQSTASRGAWQSAMSFVSEPSDE
jgi:hypothetical protein